MQRPGNNWDGHLPSCKMERAILNAMDEQEDEDGNLQSFLKLDDPEMAVFRQRQKNTGPKGVKEDARRHYAMQMLQKQADKVRDQELLRRNANATCRPAGESSDDEDKDEEDEEDEEFRKYRLARLQQMQSAASASAKMPTFGCVEPTTPDDFPGACDNPGSSETYVVACLQEDYLPACVRLNYKLEILAKKYDQVRFLSLSASAAKPDLEPERLPCLLVYHKNGDYVGSLERVGKEAGESLTVDAVEGFLCRLGVRLSCSAAMKAADAAALNRLRELGGEMPASLRHGGAEDDDDEDYDDEDEDGEHEEPRRQFAGSAGIRRMGNLSIS
jgi:hypothetical protein